MPTKTKTTAAAPASLIDRITAQLPEHAAHAKSVATLARWQREAAKLRTTALTESIEDRAAADGPLPLDLLRETMASEQEAVVINRLRGELQNLSRVHSLYRLSAEEAARAAALLQEQLDELMDHVAARAEDHELPLTSDEAIAGGPAAVELYQQLTAAVDELDEIRQAQRHFTRLSLTEATEHRWNEHFYRVGMYREQLDLDRAWLARRHAAGAEHPNTSDAATLAFNAWLRPKPEQTRDAWTQVGGDTAWPCTNRVEYIIWLAENTSPFVPTNDELAALYEHAHIATMDLDPDRVEVAEHHRDAYWRLAGVKPVVPYTNHTAAQRITHSLGYQNRR